jgi:hypothetical protein
MLLFHRRPYDRAGRLEGVEGKCREHELPQSAGEAVAARFARPALVNGTAGFVVAPRGQPVAVAGFTVAHGRIVEIDLLADPARLRELDLPALDD